MDDNRPKLGMMDVGEVTYTGPLAYLASDGAVLVQHRGGGRGGSPTAGAAADAHDATARFRDNGDTLL